MKCHYDKPHCFKARYYAVGGGVHIVLLCKRCVDYRSAVLSRDFPWVEIKSIENIRKRRKPTKQVGFTHAG